MKQTFLVILTWMMLGISSMSAQSYLGSWVADNSFKEQLKELLDEEGVDMNLGFVITKSDITSEVYMTIMSDDLHLELTITTPGTYTKQGDKFTPKFFTDKADLVVTSMKSDDPEVNEGLELEETKDIWRRVITQMMKEKIGDNLKVMSDAIADAFKEFRLQQETANKLTLLVQDDEGDGVEIDFHRMR